MPFIIYVLTIILVSLISIIIGNIIVFVDNIIHATIILTAVTICIFILLGYIVNSLMKKFILISIYFPIIFFNIVKLSIIVIEYFDKQNPPF
jgi:hypothetical protein